jgi:23S rRNA (guanosine2251-2'-O)-methyltransferase
MPKICRLNPLYEALKAASCRVQNILIQKDFKNKKIEGLVALAEARHIPYSLVSRQDLDMLDPHHQGAVAFVGEKRMTSLQNMLDQSPLPFLILLDGVEDPQNLGAILRTAEAAGVDGIVIPERRAVGLTEAVRRVSAGAAEHVRMARTKNLSQTMDWLRKEQVWLVGAEGGSRRNWYEFDYTMPVAIVLGSEGKGLRPLIRKKCDEVLSIPLFGQLTSLNVAAAAAVFLFEVVRQRKEKLFE